MDFPYRKQNISVPENALHYITNTTNDFCLRCGISDETAEFCDSCAIRIFLDSLNTQN